MATATRRRTILLADADPHARRELSLAFDEHGDSVIAVTGGEACLWFAKRSRPDVVMLDLVLPDIDGLAVIEHLRNDQVTADLPIAVATANATPEAYKLAREAGCDLFIPKPIDPAQLLMRIDQLLKWHAQQDVTSREQREQSHQLLAAADIQFALTRHQIDSARARLNGTWSTMEDTIRLHEGNHRPDVSL